MSGVDGSLMKFRKKPIVIEAMQFDGTPGRAAAIHLWSRGQAMAIDPPGTLVIWTLEGRLTANSGDWIIRGIAGEFYPCKSEIFEKSYELVAEAPFGCSSEEA